MQADEKHPLTIRRARPEEAEALTALTLASKKSNGYDDTFIEMCREELSVTPSQISGHNYWVAETDELCGCVCLTVLDLDNADVGKISAFFIAPHFKRQGIGTALWQKVLEQANDLKFHTLILDADPEAVPFYESLGFKTTKLTPSGSIPGRMIPQMTRINNPHTKSLTS